jgi:acyl-CoA hydrolase
MQQYVSAEEAVSIIKSGNRVFLHGSAATPIYLINKLLDRFEELRNVELVSITSFGNIDFGNVKYKDSFYINSLFVSANTRSAVNSAQGDYVPIFLSEIPRLFYEN